MLLRTALILLLSPAWLLAQFGPGPQRPESQPDDTAAKAAKATDQQNRQKYGNDANYFVRPGLLANKTDKTVRIWGKATGISPSDPLEFFAIPADSGKDYESLSVVFAKPSDVQSALEFIGMKPGRPVNFAKDQYWPKGERVKMTFEWDQPGEKPGEAPKPAKAPAETLLLNARTNKPMDESGFVFTGSFHIKSGEKSAFAADVMDAKSIASDYNEPASILDVPRQASKGVVYATQKANPAYRFKANQPLQIVLEPLHKDLEPRVHDAVLSFSIPPDVNIQGGKFILTDPNGKRLTRGDGLIDMLAGFENLTDAGEDIFITLKPDPSIHLDKLSQFYSVLESMDVEKGIRIDAPAPGDLYYKAFFPDPKWRDRDNRLGRPWELHLVLKDRQVAGNLILPADSIDDNGGKGDLRFTVGKPEELARILVDKSDKFAQTVYIFAPPSMTYGELMTFIRPAMKTHQMYVFLPEKPKPAPAP